MLLPTPIGPLWLEVSAKGVRRLEPVLFPRGQEAEGPLAERVAEGVARYFRGERPDFLRIPLDYSGLSPWRVAVYEATRRVPYGKTASYGSLGRALGLPPPGGGDGPSHLPFPSLGACPPGHPCRWAAWGVRRAGGAEALALAL